MHLRTTARPDALLPLTALTPGLPPTDSPERIERLARRLLGAPAAWLGLRMDVRARLAAHGAATGGASIEDDSAEAILARSVLRDSVPIVLADAGNVVLGDVGRALRVRGWQSYLGVPVRRDGGAVIGVLAVADTAPHAWTEADVSALFDLAAITADALATAGQDGPRWLSEIAQREAHDARRKSEERLALIFNSTSDLTFLVAVEDRDRYRVVAVNESYLTATGLPERDIVGRLVDEVLPANAATFARARYAEAIAAGEQIVYEESVELPIGPLLVETSLTPIHDDAGVCTHLLGVARDVTERRRHELELRQARDAAEAARSAAEQASEAKSEFLSRMSHELRTPLNSVIGFANVLRANKGQRLDPRDLNFLDRIITNGQHLLTIISDLLDISRIEAGKMPVSVTPVPLAPLVRTTAGGFEAQLVGRDVTLRIELPSELARLETDATRLQQVLINLIGNAIKFTERGSITVRVVADPATARPLRLEVQDTGIGIPPNRLEAIFNAFEQAETGTTRAYGGTGLGLAISRSLCQLLGFGLSVRSAPGEGATFGIHFDGADADSASS